MQNIELDESGNPIDRLAERNEEIIDKLKDGLNLLLKEKRENEGRRRPQPIRFGYRFGMQLNRVLRQYGIMTADEVCKIDYDIIVDNFYKYLDLISYYNQFFDVPCFKQDFCAFFRINERIYRRLENSTDEDIKNLMQSINDTWIGLGFVAGEAGNMDSKAIMSRLKIKDAGMNLVENAFDATINITARKDATPMELERKLQQVISGATKLGGTK